MKTIDPVEGWKSLPGGGVESAGGNELDPQAVWGLGLSLNESGPPSGHVETYSSRMAWHRMWSLSIRVISGLSAALLTVAVVLYAPIGLGTQSPTEMAVRTHVLLAVLMVSAAATWILTTRPQSPLPRLISGIAGGFNVIWIISFVGLPVVVASIVAICVSAIGVPRRLAFAVVALATVGLGLALVFIRLTEPPGEHIFG